MRWASSALRRRKKSFCFPGGRSCAGAHSAQQPAALGIGGCGGVKDGKFCGLDGPGEDAASGQCADQSHARGVLVASQLGPSGQKARRSDPRMSQVARDAPSIGLTALVEFEAEEPERDLGLAVGTLDQADRLVRARATLIRSAPLGAEVDLVVSRDG